jgi:hypothetical protein
MISNDERRLLIDFAKNKPLFDAVRKQLLKGIISPDGDFDFTNTNWVWNIDHNLTDAAYGKQVKLTKKAIEWIRQGFIDIQQIRPDVEAKEPENESR